MCFCEPYLLASQNGLASVGISGGDNLGVDETGWAVAHRSDHFAGRICVLSRQTMNHFTGITSHASPNMTPCMMQPDVCPSLLRGSLNNTMFQAYVNEVTFNIKDRVENLIVLSLDGLLSTMKMLKLFLHLYSICSCIGQMIIMMRTQSNEK